MKALLEKVARWLRSHWDDAGTLTPVVGPLPVRLVEAAVSAMDMVRVCSYTALDGCHIIEGYDVDFARVAAGAVVDVLADALEGELCCGQDPAPQCLKCGQLYAEIGHMRSLADAVRDVPALVAS